MPRRYRFKEHHEVAKSADGGINDYYMSNGLLLVLLYRHADLHMARAYWVDLIACWRSVAAAVKEGSTSLARCAIRR